MSVIDATVPPAEYTAREDGGPDYHSDRRPQQQHQQQQTQQQHQIGSATSVGAGGPTLDDSERRGSWTPDTVAVTSTADNYAADNDATDRTPLLTRRVTYRDEDGSSNGGVDRGVVDGQVNLIRIYASVAT